MNGIEWAASFVGRVLKTGGVVNGSPRGIYPSDDDCASLGRDFPGAVRMLADKLKEVREEKEDKNVRTS